MGPMNVAHAGAVLFDLDGVITPTADVHMAAWSRMFNDFLTRRAGEAPYTDEDYFLYVDGKPRYDGVRSFLNSRGIALDKGSPSDSPSADTVCGLGNRKNEAFNAVLARDGIEAYPGSLDLLDHLDALGMPMAIVSSSRNARSVLDAAGLTHRFRAIVDGSVAADEGLPGKPAPDTFLRAAALLGVSPSRCVVVEDAVSGVMAGRAGNFAHVVGINRGVGADALIGAGADLVVGDLAELITPESAT